MTKEELRKEFDVAFWLELGKPSIDSAFDWFWSKLKANNNIIKDKDQLMQDLLDDIEMNIDDWCRTPLVMATKLRDKQFRQENL